LLGLTFRQFQAQFHIMLFTFAAASNDDGIILAGDGNVAGFPHPFRRVGVIGMNSDAVPRIRQMILVYPLEHILMEPLPKLRQVGIGFIESRVFIPHGKDNAVDGGVQFPFGAVGFGISVTNVGVDLVGSHSAYNLWQVRPVQCAGRWCFCFIFGRLLRRNEMVV